MSGSPRPSLRVRILGYGLMILAPLALAALLEGVGLVYLKSRGEPTHRPFVRRGAIQEAKGLFDTRDSFSYLDPHLSHAHNPASLTRLGLKHIPGFAIFGAAEDPEAATVVALGGSTTDPVAGTSWPEFLAERLARDGYSVRVLNGGVAGYSSNQELLKLIRDVLPLKPALILSLNGVNDLGFLHSAPAHPMVHPYQKRILSAVAGAGTNAPLLMPNAVSAAIDLFSGPPEIGINLGTEADPRDYEQWFANVRMMHAVSAEFGIPYVCFLQPILGVGDYEASAEEEAMLEKTATQHAPARDYKAEMVHFYTGARDEAKRAPYVVDLVDVFAGEAGMYNDARHQTAAGRKHLADAVFQHCLRLGVLDGVRRNLGSPPPPGAP